MKIILLFIGLLISTFVSSQTQKQAVRDIQNLNDTLLTFISTWWKTPYRYGGTTKKGIDCSSFTQKLYKKVYNISLPRVASQQYKYTMKIKKSELQEGDLVFFRTRAKSTWHVGVYLNKGWFVHSSSGVGVFINTLDDARWKAIYYGATRLTKLQ